MSDQQARLSRFIDEAGIRNAIARFADSATRCDYKAFRATWAEDGEFVIGKSPDGQSAVGADSIVDMLRRLQAGKDFFIQFAMPGVIEITGDDATTRTFVQEAARGPGETFYRNYSIAFDRLRRSGDEWLFVSRSFQYVWLDTGVFAGHAFPLFTQDR